MFKHKKIKRFKTSEIELIDLFKAWLVISVAFAIAFSEGIRTLITNYVLVLFFYAALTVGIGFLLHELTHKIVAQHYGYFAEFRADNIMLLLSLIFSFFGFVIAAPGAVMISGEAVNERKNGIISLAGPLTNIILSLIFLFFYYLLPSEFFSLGFRINSWLALFNLIPFGLFDGSKVFRWSKKIWLFTTIIPFLMVFFVRF